MRHVLETVQSDKLKSLQEVLESDFLYSITNVYQSIYDTVDLTSTNKESAAIATAKGNGLQQKLSENNIFSLPSFFSNSGELILK